MPSIDKEHRSRTTIDGKGRKLRRQEAMAAFKNTEVERKLEDDFRDGTFNKESNAAEARKTRPFYTARGGNTDAWRGRFNEIKK